jgi:predicted GTPase
MKGTTMSTQNHTQVSLKELATLIATVGRDVTILARGEPGIGKSSVFHALKAAPQFAATHAPLYLDCTLLDVGDLQIPVVDTETKKYAFTPNAMFVTSPQKPMLIMLDEIGKDQGRCVIPCYR